MNDRACATFPCNDYQHLTRLRHVIKVCANISLVESIWTIEVLPYHNCSRNTLFMCVQKMTLLFIFLKLSYAIFYKTFSKSFRLFLKLCLVRTHISEMTHIALQTPGIFWIYFLGISILLQNPLGSPWYFYFSTIVTDCLDTKYNYIGYNPGVPLVLTRA